MKRMAQLTGLLLTLAACGGKSAPEYIARGKAAMENHNYAQARIEFGKATHADPLLAEAYYQSGLAAQALNMRGTAYDAFAAAEQRDRRPANEYYSVDVRLRLGLMMLYAHNYQGVRQRAQWVLQREPHNPKARELLAFALASDAQPQLAAESLDDLLSSEPRNLQGRMMRSSIYFSFGQVEDAIKQLEAGLEQTGRSPEALLALGNLYQVAGQPDKAPPYYQEAIRANPKSVNPYLGLGWLYARVGNRVKAEETFRDVARILPDDPDALMALGNFYMNRMELTQALRELERVAALSKAPMIHDRLAGCYYLAGHFDEAEKTVRAVLATDAQDVQAHLLLGMLYLRTNRNSEAGNEFTSAVAKSPDYAAAHFYLGISLYNGHNESVALQEMESALRLDPYMLTARIWHSELLLLDNSPSQALSVLQEAPEAQKNVPIVRLLRAMCVQGMNDEVKALEEVRGLLAVDPKLIASFYTMGFGQLLDKHVQIAKQALELGLKADPASLDILQVLARNLISEGHPDQAITRVQQQMKLTKVTPEQYQLLGDIYRVSGQYPAAREAFNKAESMGYDSPAPILGLLQTELADGHPEAARPYADKLSSSWPRSALAWTWKGVVMEGLRNFQEADRSYEKALALDSKQPVAAQNLARRLLMDGGDLSRALNWATQAREQQPNNPLAADTLAWIYYKHGTLHFAEVQSTAAIKMDPKNGMFQYHQGCILADQGNDKQALAALKEALRLDPKLPEALDALKRIDDIKDRLSQ